MTALEVRNMDPALLRRYLTADLGGAPAPDGSFRGADWQARLVSLPPALVGRLPVRALAVEFSGPGAERAAAALRPLCMRGGG